MIPEIGHFTLILALSLAMAQGVFPLLGAARGNRAWMRVGGSFSSFRLHSDHSFMTYAKAVALFPDDPQPLVDYADVMAMANGGRLLGKPEQLVAHALRADPNNAKALALAGTVAFDKQDFALAIKYWERLRNSMPKDSEFVKSVEASITAARRLSLASADPRSEKRTPQ